MSNYKAVSDVDEEQFEEEKGYDKDGRSKTALTVDQETKLDENNMEKGKEITFIVDRVHGLNLIVPDHNWGPMHIYDRRNNDNINGIVITADINCPTCIGDYKLTQGKWYYEVKVIKTKNARFGWGLHSQRNSSYKYRAIGNDSKGWAFGLDNGTPQKWTGDESTDLENKQLQFPDEEYPWYDSDDEAKNGQDYGKVFQKDDIIGCSIDIDNKQMNFYLNEEDLGVAFKDFKLKEGISPCMTIENGGEFIIITDENKLHNIPDGFKPLPIQLNRENIVTTSQSKRFRGNVIEINHEKMNNHSYIESKHPVPMIFVGIRLKKPFFHKNDSIELFIDGEKQNMYDPYKEYRHSYEFRQLECQILCETKYELPEVIKFQIADREWSEEVSYGDIEWISTSRNTDIEDITEIKMYETDKYEIYEEYINIWRSVSYPNEEQCMTLVDPENGIDDLKEIDLKNLNYYWGSDQQIFYDKKHNLVYGICTDTILKSKVFGGENRFAKNEFCIYKGEENITWKWMTCCRYNWLINMCLYGQDNEFNIFRSMCFVPPQSIDEIGGRLSMGILCLMLQSILTVSIVYDVKDNWDMNNMFDNEAIIIIISFMTFTFISFMYSFTTQKYWEFYGNMHEIIIVPWFIRTLDFCSNILIGFIICLISLFYLLQSESIADVVLNSFALTFIIELDDMANLYEADEDALVAADFEYIESGENFEHRIKKRRIEINSKEIICWVTMVTLLSPLRIFLSIWKTFAGFAFGIKHKDRKQYSKEYKSFSAWEEIICRDY